MPPSVDDASLLARYDFSSHASYGAIDVWLGRRRRAQGEETGSGPEEVLYVRVPDEWKEEDLDAYCRFHRSYVSHRARHKWPHTFAVLYDGRSASSPRDVPSFLAQAACFVSTQQACGDHYVTLLHRIVLLVSEPGVGALIQRLAAPFKPTKPLVVHCEGEEGGATLAEKVGG